MTFEQQKNAKAIIWTAGVHSLLLLLFLFFKYTMPVQEPVEDLGMEVNLGTSDNGSGTDQAELQEDPAAAVAVANSPSSPPENRVSEVYTSGDNDAPAVSVNRNRNNKKNNIVPVTTNKRRSSNNLVAVRTNNQPVPAQQAPRYVYPGAAGKGGNGAQNNRPGGNEGIGQGDGDMGVPGGTPGAANYSGVPGAGGTTIGHSISGRNLVSRPDPKAEFREGGRVVIRVTVNKEGMITDSRVVSAANAAIRVLAMKKLQGVRFNKSATAPAEQFGNITFNFKTTRK